MLKRSFLLVLVGAALAVLFVTCGKKAPPLPPVYIVPQPPIDAIVLQSGDSLMYMFRLPTLSTDYRTPADIGEIEVFRMKETRVPPAVPQTQPQTQPQPQTQTQMQTQSAPQTQTAPTTQPVGPPQTAPLPQQPVIPQTQTQTQSQPQSQKQTQTQTQTQTAPRRPETPRQIAEEEFKERSEKIAEIPQEQIAGYIRGDYFIIVDKLNIAADSEDLKNWYHYGVRFFNKRGRAGEISKPAALFPEIVPVAPDNFTAKVTEKAIELSWNPVKTDIAGKPLPPEQLVYSVYRGPSANFPPRQPINTSPLSATTYSDSTFEFGKPYYYFIRASVVSHRREQESAPSNAVLIYPQDIFPPAAPQELNAVPAREGMVLIWAPNAEEDVAGYNIYRSTQAGAAYGKINKQLVRETTFTDKEIETGQTYYYVVTAVDNAPNPNESQKSNEVSEIKRRQ